MSAIRYPDDGKYHSTGEEHALSKFLDAIDKLDISEDKKTEWRVLFQKGFDLGFACGNKYADKRLQEQIESLTKMDKDELTDFGELVRLLNGLEMDYRSLK